MTYYYNRCGEPISVHEWSDLYRDEDYRRVAHAEIGGVGVLTTWGGVGIGDGPMGTYESLILYGDLDVEQWYYATEAEAKAGHDRIVAALEAGETP